MKTGYFILIRKRDSRNTVLDGPFPTYGSADTAAQEVNSNLARPPFAFVRRTANAKQTAAWSTT